MTRRSPCLSLLIAAALLALAALAAGCSSGAAGLTQAGNQAFARQAYDEALQSYQAAQARMPQLAEAHYNAANALYRQGKYPEALRELGKAVQYARDDRAAAQSYYNQGNAAYNDNQMEAAVESYTQVLLRDPNDADAKHNLELALQKQQQQNQNQQNQNQDQNNQLNMDQQQQNQGQPEQRQPKPQKQPQPQQNPPKPRPGQPDPQQQAPRQPRQNPESGPGQGMTEEQARQLLSAIARKSGKLPSQLGAGQSARDNPPAQDW